LAPQAGSPCFLDCETHVLEDSGSHMLYAPLEGVAIVLGGRAALWLRNLQQSPGLVLPAEHVCLAFHLSQLGLLWPEPIPPRISASPADDTFRPTETTLFLTGRCNLRCRYCYALGGEQPVTMPIAIAASAIELVVRNAKASGAGKAVVHFHGGGEPTQALDRMREIVGGARACARQAGVELQFTLGTNGVMSDEAVDWVIRSIFHATVSADGDAVAQNRNRPMADGSGSFASLIRTLSRFDQDGFNHSLRMTVTAQDAQRLPELVQSLMAVSRARRIKVEPMFASGRGSGMTDSTFDPSAFVEGFCAAMIVAGGEGRELSYSGYRPDVATDRFCAAAGRSMCVTPTGDVSACYEVTDRADARASRFFIGEWVDGRNGFRFDEQRLAWLRSQTVNQIPECAGCLAKWHCAGDCPAKAEFPQSRLASRPGHRTWRCTINRELIRRAVWKRALDGIDLRSGSEPP
jgi:uncharacterized protein